MAEASNLLRKDDLLAVFPNVGAGQLKGWLEHRGRNGLAPHVYKVGKYLFIDRVGFSDWILSHNVTNTKGEKSC